MLRLNIFDGNQSYISKFISRTGWGWLEFNGFWVSFGITNLEDRLCGLPQPGEEEIFYEWNALFLLRSLFSLRREVNALKIMVIIVDYKVQQCFQ